MTYTLRGHKLGIPHSVQVDTEGEALAEIRKSVTLDSWRVSDVLGPDGVVALTENATRAVRIEQRALLEAALRQGRLR